MNMDQKWDRVKEFYEENYKMRFTSRISDEDINYLNSQINVLSKDLVLHQCEAHLYLNRIRTRKLSLVDNS